MDLIYLACPYSDKSVEKMKERVEIATQITANLMLHGDNVFSPLTHSSHVADYISEENRRSHDFWLARDFQIIRKCDKLYVLCIEGWNDSFGVKEEIKFAQQHEIPVTYVYISITHKCITHMVKSKYNKVDIKPDILQEAHDIINGERQDQYGKPENSFQIIAGFWNVYLENRDLEKPLVAKDIAIMMSLLKHARILGTGESRDNAKDAIGYLAIFEDRL